MDFSALIDILYETLRAVAVAGAAAIVPFVIKWLMDRTKIDELLGDDMVRTYLNDAFERALKAGFKYADTKVGQLNSTVEIENEVLEFALEYVQKAVPGALAHFDLGPEDVKNRLLARFEDVLKVTADERLLKV
jgi:hypothetical protein